MTKTKELSTVEIQNRLELHRLHKALTDDDLKFGDIETMCLVMYKMGISPLTTVRKYLGKYSLKSNVVYISANTTKMCDITAKLKPETPTIIIYMKDSWGDTVGNVALQYYPALKRTDERKYSRINFTSILLK